MRSAVLLMCLLGVDLIAAVFSLKICSFNIKNFGKAKANNKKVMVILVKIISRCDLSLIQEVRDCKGEAVPALMLMLSRFDKSHAYSHLESKRLGKTTYKEQYVYIYRKDVLQVQEQFYHPDLRETNDTEMFSRQALVIRVHSPTTFVKNFAIIGHHTSPKQAMKEMEELFGVFQVVKKKWKTENVMLLGDLNADCGYVTVKGLKNLRLRNDPKFHWLITDEQDTTDNCTWQRTNFRDCAGIRSTLQLQKEFRLTEQEALDVSDHYPVEVDLKANRQYFLHNEL